MSSTEVLQSAIQAARAGRKKEARDLLIELVENDPQNEMVGIDFRQRKQKTSQRDER